MLSACPGITATQSSVHLETDASAYGLGCSLFKTHLDGNCNPIGFLYRSLRDAELNFSAPEPECLGIVWALQAFRPCFI